MLSALRNLFSSPPVNRERVSRTPAERVPHNKGVKPNRKLVDVSPRKIDAAFYGLILGVQSPIHSKLNAFEKRVLHELDQLLASDISHCDLVPR